MSARAIVSGVLFRPPVEKISKAGKPYVIATVREGNGDATRWWKILFFNEPAREEALRLGDGEPIAVAGEFDANVWAPEGREPRVNLTLTADAILSARKPNKAAKSIKATNGRAIAAASWAAPTLGGDHGR